MRESDGLRAEIEERDGVCVLRLEGQLTFAEAEPFEQQARRLYDRRAKRVVVDMSGVKMITSAGIGALLRLNKRMKELGAEVRLAASLPDIDRILRMSGLEKMFVLKSSVESAVQES